MNVTAHEIGSPLSIKRRTTGTIPHSQIGKQSPRRPLTSVAKKPFLGSSPVITFDGMKAAMAPEISEPIRTNGSPSNARARNENKKFCHVNVNQLIFPANDNRPVRTTTEIFVHLLLRLRLRCLIGPDC